MCMRIKLWARVRTGLYVTWFVPASNTSNIKDELLLIQHIYGTNLNQSWFSSIVWEEIIRFGDYPCVLFDFRIKSAMKQGFSCYFEVESSIEVASLYTKKQARII